VVKYVQVEVSPETRGLIGLLADYAQIASVVGPSVYFLVRFFKKNRFRDIAPIFVPSSPITLGIARPTFKKSRFGDISTFLSQKKFGNFSSGQADWIQGSFVRSVAIRPSYDLDIAFAFSKKPLA
jgi:hypothetical protein